MASKLFDRLYERRYITAPQTLGLYLGMLALSALLHFVIFLGSR